MCVVNVVKNERRHPNDSELEMIEAKFVFMKAQKHKQREF